MSANNNQVGGDHYKKLKIQAWDFIIANDLDFLRGNIVKYIVRKKGDIHKQHEDLLKARHYLDKLIGETSENKT